VLAPPALLCVYNQEALMASGKTALRIDYDAQSGRLRAVLTVPAPKLRGKDLRVVSPQIVVPGRFFGRSEIVPFRILLIATPTDTQKRGSSFQRSKGKGSIEFICESTLVDGTPDVGVAFAVGRDEETALYRVVALNHDFSRQACCRLPTASDEWAFSEFLDPASRFFVVVIEISQLNYTVQSPYGSTPRLADSSLRLADMDIDEKFESFNQRCAATVGKKEEAERWADMDSDDEEEWFKFENKRSMLHK